MKAKDFDKIKTTTDIYVQEYNYTIPSGTEGRVVDCYYEPHESYGVDLPLPEGFGDAPLVSMILNPSEFIVIEK